jgi:hypothetical protein
MINANEVKNDSLRVRFDAAFRIPAGDQFHVPAMFYNGGHVIGIERLQRAVQNGTLPKAERPVSEASGFLWTRWSDYLLAGLSLLAVAGLVHPPARSRVAGAAMALVALTFLVSGVPKLLDSGAFITQVNQMALLPMVLVRWAWLVGLAEVGIALGLTWRQGRMLVLIVSALLLAGFSFLTVTLLVRGYAGDCGCFPWRDHLGWWTLERDVALLLLICILTLRHAVTCRPWTRDGATPMLSAILVGAVGEEV